MPSLISKEDQRFYARGCRGAGRQVAIFQPFHHAHALSSFVAINYSVIKAERQC